jgi:ABC-type antimicrobial peptide transport system permease subunit
MIISVLERRREIGLRRSLGATRGHIRTQFLTEALLLSALGGVFGCGLGATAAPANPTDHQANAYLRATPSAGLGLASTAWTAMKSASLTSAGCATAFEITQSRGWFHRCPARFRLALESWSVHCRFHTCRPV